MSDFNVESAAAAIGASTAALLIFLAVFIFAVVCLWKVYAKMGEPGWASLIPFYCNWVLCKHTWDGKGAMMFTWLIPFVGSIFMIITWFKLFKGFGKSALFAIFGLFFTPIALAICAFGNAEYTDQ